MSEIWKLRVELKFAQERLQRAVSSEELSDMKFFATAAASRIQRGLSMTEPHASADRCPNPVCNRVILDRDPIFAGFCSTMCREGSLAGSRIATSQEVRSTIAEKVEAGSL